LYAYILLYCYIYPGEYQCATKRVLNPWTITKSKFPAA
jgi:hypothetical protein